MDKRPIGVFDSGIGGLTVLKELCHHFPFEEFIYLGDTARLPYGSKSPETIRQYSLQNMKTLAQQDVKALVIACNSASTQYRESHFEQIPVYNVIAPGAQKALQVSQSRRIGVLGTRATVQSQAYAQEVFALDDKAQVFSQACPLFVPLAEEGWDNDPITNLIVYRYLEPLLRNNIDTLILGCTHYPLLKSSIYRVTGSAIELVDSGEAIAEWMKLDIAQGKLQMNSNDHQGSVQVWTTDSSDHFNRLAVKIMDPVQIQEFKRV